MSVVKSNAASLAFSVILVIGVAALFARYVKGPASQGVTLVQTIERLDRGQDLERVIDELRHCQATCIASEQRAATHLLEFVQLFQNAAAEPDETDRALASYARAIRTLLPVYEHDVRSLETLVTAANNLLRLMKTLRSDPNGFDRETRQAAAALVEQYPNEPRAYAILGDVLDTTGANEREIIEAFAQCLRLEPGNASCQAAYRREVSEYTHEHCRPAGLAGPLRAYVADASFEASQGVAALKSEPVLDSSDLERLSANKDETSGQSGLSLQFTPSGAVKLASVTRDNIGKKLVLVLNDRVLVDPVIMQAIEAGQVEVKLGVESSGASSAVATAGRVSGAELFERLCPRPTRDRLPAELIVPGGEGK